MSSLLEYCQNGLCLPIDSTTFSELHRRKDDDEIINLSSCSSTLKVPDQIQNILKKCLLFEESGFPGPMCCPFRKANIPTIKETVYTVMEKSDGLRVLIVGCEAQTFPVWRQVETNTIVTNRYSATAALEKVRGENGSENCSVTINGIEFSFCFNKEINTYTLKSANELLICRRSLESRLLLYGMDRSLGVYIFDTIFNSAEVSMFVGDSELLYSPSLNNSPYFAFFDLYGMAEKGEETIICQSRSTTMRHKALKKVLDNIHLSHEESIFSCDFASLKLYAKELFYIDNLPALIQKIHFNTLMKKHYIVGSHGMTLNDGLVFTPEDFECKGGAQAAQLKWKWTDSLTVDWKIHAANEQGMYFVFLYLKQKCYPFKEDIEGHWRIWKPMELANPNNVEISQDPAKAVVVECNFDTSNNIWSILHIRKDKRIANSISTVISVFESIAENCTLLFLVESLCSSVDQETKEHIQTLLQHQHEATNSIARKSEKDFENAQDRTFATFALRAKSFSQQHKLHLTWCTNKTNDSHEKIIHVPLCEVRECSGIGFPYPESGFNNTLHHLLMLKVGNAGGTYAWSDFVVEAFFDPDIGRWVLCGLKSDGKNYMCTFENILMHLHCVMSGKRRKKTCKNLPLALPYISQEQTLVTNKHYAMKVEELEKVTRNYFREFNNLVKAHQIQWASNLAKELLHVEKLKVIDLCCGRGGDLSKWASFPLEFLFLTDASIECVSEAAARYSTAKGMSLKCKEKPGFKARFAVHDAFDFQQKTLMKELNVMVARGNSFHIASCQLSIHYSCGNKDHLDYFLSCVSTCLVPGGLFIGTTLSDQSLFHIFQTYGPDFISDRIEIHFPSESVKALEECGKDVALLNFGIEYSFTVENYVSDLPEYIVPWHKFCHLCEEHSLMPVSNATFSEYALDNEQELSLLAQRGSFFSRKRDSSGNLAICHIGEGDKLLEISNSLYTTFAFKKK